MELSDINILIVDHQTFGENLADRLKQVGFNAILVKNPADAVSQFELTIIHAFVIETFLSQQSGIELAKELRKLGADTQPFYFMSGIFKSRRNIQKVLSEAGGEDFFIKPLNYDHIINTFVKKFKQASLSFSDKFFQSFTDSNFDESYNSILNNTDHISGYHIPTLLGFLLFSKAMGLIRLKTKENKIIKIYVFDGIVTSVVSGDSKSYLGVLLIEKNIITSEELDFYLEQKNDKKIGTRLIEANLVSPHMIDEIAEEQTYIRLSKLISNTSYSFSFSEINVPKDKRLSVDVANKQLIKWVFLKLPVEFMESLYMSYYDSRISGSVNFQRKKSLLHSPYISRSFKSVLTQIFEEEPTISKVISLVNNTDIYRLIHILVLLKVVTLSDKKVKIDFRSRLKVLTNYKEKLKIKNYYQILNANPDEEFNSLQIKSNYLGLSKSFHPDKVDPNAPDELKALHQELFNIITSAYHTLMNKEKRKEYLSSIESGKFDRSYSMNSLIKEGTKHLKSYKFDLAYQKFSEAMKLDAPTSELKIYFMWAKLASHSSREIKQEDMLDLIETMDNIPVEDRNNCNYYFVKGIFHKKIGDYDLAALNFKKAIVLDRKFIIAKSELRKVEKLLKSNLLHVKLGEAGKKIKKILLKKVG